MQRNNSLACELQRKYIPGCNNIEVQPARSILITMQHLCLDWKTANCSQSSNIDASVTIIGFAVYCLSRQVCCMVTLRAIKQLAHGHAAGH